MNLRLKSRSNKFQNVILFSLVFFFIFSPRLSLPFPIHTGFLGIALFGSWVLIMRRRSISFSIPVMQIIGFFIFLATYHSIISFYFDNEWIHFVSICISVIVSFLFGWLFANYMDLSSSPSSNLYDSILVMLCAAAVANSSLILFEYFNPEVKIMIESLLVQVKDGNIDYATHSFRIRGLASAGGASLSVFNAVNIISFIFLWRLGRVSAVLAISGSTILTLSNIFTGRTGLILSLIFLTILVFFVFAANLRKGFSGLKFTFILLTLLATFYRFIASFELDSEAAGWAFEWLDNIDSGSVSSASSDDLQSMLFLPDNPLHLLLGIGFFEGYGSLYPRSDSGYVKSILSIGLPLSFSLYLLLVLVFSSIILVAKKYLFFIIPVVLVMLIIEIKEPFFYQNFLGRFLILLSAASLYMLHKAKRRTFALRKSSVSTFIK